MEMGIGGLAVPCRSGGATNALLDVSERSASGLFAYALLWVTVSAVSGAYQQSPFWVSLIGGTLFAIAALRTLVRARLPRLVKLHQRRAYLTFVVLTLVNALVWGGATAYCVGHESLQVMLTPVLLATCGIATAATAVYAIDSVLLYLYPSCLIAPSVPFLIFGYAPDHIMYGSLALILLAYVMLAGRSAHNDYWGRESHKVQLDERARELERISTTDGLTQLHNRMYFDSRFEQAWKQSFRLGKSMSVMLLDLDHFRRINDRYGHAFGDLLLQAVARVLDSAVDRSGNLIARYGGEEFIILLGNTANEGAEVVAEHLLAAIRSIKLEFGGEYVPISASIGVSSTKPISADRGYRLINDADRALYKAKQDGRDRLVVSTSAIGAH
jgi:diguanylate cyclase (GGDEF)-like protein